MARIGSTQIIPYEARPYSLVAQVFVLSTSSNNLIKKYREKKEEKWFERERSK